MIKKLYEKFISLSFMVCYRKMWQFVKPIWFRTLLALVICVPIGAMDGLIAYSLKPFTDTVMLNKGMNSVSYLLPLAIILFTATQGVLNYIADYLNIWVGGKMTMALKLKLYRKLVTFETDFFDKTTSGEILFRFNSDANDSCATLLNNLKLFITRIFSAISLFFVLIYNSWQLSLIALSFLLIAVLPLSKIKSMIKSIVSQSNISITTLNTSYNETFAGNRTITAYNLQEYESRRFEDILKNIFNYSIKICQRTSWVSPFMHFAVSVGVALAIWLGSWLIAKNYITSGNFLAFIVALILLYKPLKNLGQNIVSAQYSFLAIERAFEMIEKPLSIKDSLNAIELNGIKDGIEYKDVCFEYKENTPVLKNINLKIKSGETVAFVGNSGGGKTTLVNLLPRFYEVNSGEILIDGRNIKDYTVKSLRSQMAIVFQDNFLFSGTIRENIIIGNENASEQDIKYAVEQACLSDFIKSLDNGLDTEIGERGILLSGGQKQRVAIARAFLKNAPIIILDEATSALDNKSEKIVQKAIDNLMKDKTVLIIAHRLSTVQNADKIVVVNEGIISEVGSHYELMKLPNGKYKQLYDLQFMSLAML